MERAEETPRGNKLPAFVLKAYIHLIGIGLVLGVLTISLVHTLTCQETHGFIQWAFVKNQPANVIPIKPEAPMAPSAKILALKKSSLGKSNPPSKRAKAKSNFSLSPIDRSIVVDRAQAVKNVSGVNTQAILDDPDNQISKSFKIPDALKKRTGFWLDIYTRYGEQDHVIHHTDFPWIVFDVVNTAHIDKLKLHRWTKYHKKRKLVRNQKNLIRNTLKKLSRKKSYKNLKPLEKNLYNAVKSLKGSRQKVFLRAYKKMRTQLGQRNFFLQALVNSNKYLPFIEVQFSKMNLPKELSRLPFVESSFNENAFSKVGASGIWQVMPRSARDGLILNKNIDERNSPFKSTKYAVKHLKRDYRSLKDWGMAVTAYNYGIGNISKAKRRTKAATIVDIINRNKSAAFGFASKNFFTSFLAVIHAEAYHAKIFKNVRQLTSLNVASAQLRKPIQARQLPKYLGLPMDDVYAYNMDIKKALLNNKRLPLGFRIYFPASHVNALDTTKWLRPTLYTSKNDQILRDWQDPESRNI